MRRAWTRLVDSQACRDATQGVPSLPSKKLRRWLRAKRGVQAQPATLRDRRGRELSVIGRTACESITRRTN